MDPLALNCEPKMSIKDISAALGRFALLLATPTKSASSRLLSCPLSPSALPTSLHTRCTSTRISHPLDACLSLSLPTSSCKILLFILIYSLNLPCCLCTCGKKKKKSGLSTGESGHLCFEGFGLAQCGPAPLSIGSLREKQAWGDTEILANL